MYSSDDLSIIFLEKTRKLLDVLRNEINTDTVLNKCAWRATHALKSSSRMIGLTHFSAIAYSLELLISSYKPELEQNNIKEIQNTFSQLEAEFTLLTQMANNTKH